MTPTTWEDYFAGGVPTAAYFHVKLKQLRRIVDEARTDHKFGVISLAYIGLVAYFETFSKDHFAAIVNIAPTLTRRLSENGQNTFIDASHFSDLTLNFGERIGFHIAENFDFGTSQKVNALYSALLRLSPFSKDESRKFDSILNDRNLIVHNGGTFTASYVKSATKRFRNTDSARAYWDGLEIDAERLLSDIQFLESIGKKLVFSSHAALGEYIKTERVKLSSRRKSAYIALKWWDEFGA